ncbi:Tetraspanin family protein [Histomonas meleagridis]|uniref:Tetraspanin family protein n=1 Tax=Histomonas meleagridis TaxID=135588 RepID=UPI003559B234|nr:Tetraspanin family protein [Histomonas meleagridis]KAH0804285.1 Tetraspanin family protein [Histomonas meleagridis]
MACCKNFATFLIVIANLAILIAVVIAAVIIYRNADISLWVDLIKSNIPFIFILVVAAFAVVSSIIGFLFWCCHKHKCWTITYLVLVLIVIILEVVAVVLAYLYPDTIFNQIEENWGQEGFLNATQIFEASFKCCGFRSYNKQNHTYQCGYVNYTGSENETCYNKIKDTVNENFDSLKIAVIVLIVLEFILLICSIVVSCKCKGSSSGGITNFK